MTYGELEMVDLDLLSETIYSLCLGDETELPELIFKTVVQLPKDIQEFVCEHCRFLSIGGSANALVLNGSLAFPFPLNSPDGIKWAIEHGKIENFLLNPPKLILLSGHVIDEYEPEDIMSMIAHEIAHAFLGHEPFHGGVDGFALAAKREVEACDLGRVLKL